MTKTVRDILALAALAIVALWAWSVKADSLGALAQQCANDLARRDHLDHKGFGVRGSRCVDLSGRCSRGAQAENVSYGCKDEACAIAQWMRSPGHRRNILQFGSGAIAWADSANGRRRYWCQEF